VRVVALADTHLRHDRLPSEAIPYRDASDVLVHAGDLCQHGSLEELEEAAAFLEALPHRTKVVVAGNHDVCLQKRPTEARAILARHGLVYLEDEGVVIDGVRFHGSPWQPLFRVWAFGARRGPELAAKWARIPYDVDVLVTHGPPWGFGDRVPLGRLGARRFGGSPDREVHAGCVDLRRRIEAVRPPLHVFGHIHQDRGTWKHAGMTLLNATTAEGVHPAAVVEVDPLLAQAAASRRASASGDDQKETFGAAEASALAVK
jgi:Icc-related predicted phosphoesterase